MDQVRLDPDRSGKLIETFAFNEIAAQIDASDGRYELFHYRDREKREIDFVIESEDNALLGVEITLKGGWIKRQSAKKTIKYIISSKNCLPFKQTTCLFLIPATAGIWFSLYLTES
jgi:predicted AAA+ superfamily ATPase